MLFCLHSFSNKNPIHEFPWLSNESPLLHVIFQFASLTNSGKLPQHAILIVTHLKPVAISRHFSFYRQKWNKNNSMICAGYHVWNNLPPFCWFCLHYCVRQMVRSWLSVVNWMSAAWPGVRFHTIRPNPSTWTNGGE